MNGGAISWESKRQNIVTKSSTESEYVGMSKAASQALWIRSFLMELNVNVEQPIPLFGDNQSSIKLAKNPKYHERSKHIAIQHHFIREQIEDGVIRLEYVSTGDMLADIFTKCLPKTTHQKHTKNLGIITIEEDI